MCTVLQLNTNKKFNKNERWSLTTFIINNATLDAVITSTLHLWKSFLNEEENTVNYLTLLHSCPFIDVRDYYYK